MAVGYWTDDAQWVDLSAVSSSGSCVVSSYSSIIKADISDTAVQEVSPRQGGHEVPRSSPCGMLLLTPPRVPPQPGHDDGEEAVRADNDEEALTDQERAEAKRVRMQRCVLNEIITTEREYVKDLTYVVEVLTRVVHPSGTCVP